MNRLDTLTPAPDSMDASSTPEMLLDRYVGGASGRDINVGQRERQLTLLGGAALVTLGLWRGRLGGLAMAGLGAVLVKRGIQGHCSVYERLGINTASGERPEPSELYEKGLKIFESIRVNRSAQELYDYWRDLRNHPKFMTNVEHVEVLHGGRSHWRLRGPGGVPVEYDAETINDEPGRLIAWRSVGGADVQHAGSVRFLETPDGRGTEVKLNIEYLPPAGHVGRFGEKLLHWVGQSPQDDVRESLGRFKQLMETGELQPTNGHAAARL